MKLNPSPKQQSASPAVEPPLPFPDLARPEPAPLPLDLQNFLPYRLSVLTNTVSTALARAYAERFDLTIPEWRVMAVLGHYPGLSANEVAERSAMDKVMVSRAVSRLLARRRLERAADPDDRRRKSLRLSAEGQAIYARIVPHAIAYEDALAAVLGPEDQAALNRLLAILQARAEALDGPDGAWGQISPASGDDGSA